MSFMHFSGSDAFDCANDFCWREGGYGLDEEVDMVIICSYFYEVYLVSLFYAPADVFKCVFCFFGKDLLSVFNRTDEVVKNERDVVRFFNVLTHVHIVPEVSEGNGASPGVLDPGE